MIKFLTIIFLLGIGIATYANSWHFSRPVAVKKVCYKPGETANFTSTAVFKGKTPVDATVKFEIISEVNRKETIKQENIKFIPNTPVKLAASWQVLDGSKWGHEIRITVKPKNDNSVSTSKFFATGKYPWQVGHWSNCCNTGGLKNTEEVKKRVIDAYRRWHYSAVDYFSWQPSGWETMAPEADDWISGQTGYLEKKKILQAVVNQAHKAGINVFSYYQSWSWGPAGEDFLRRHPDWWSFDSSGKPFPKGCNFDTEYLDRMRKRQRIPGPPWCYYQSGVIWRNDMKEHMLDQLKKSAEMFKWDGFRSDGLPSPGNVYDRNGKYHKVIKGDPTLAMITWINELREWLHTNVSPECFLQFNSGSVRYGLEKGDRKIFQAKARGSYCLWEGAYMAALPGSDLHNMKTFADYLHDEVKASREVGGYRHVGWMQNNPELLEATATACGAQVDWNNAWDGKPSPATYGPSAWRTFTFRFSRYFWDPNLKHIENSERLFKVKASGNLWWQTLAQERVEKDGTRYIMLHLINLPKNYPTNHKAAAPQKNIPVTLNLKTDRKVDSFVMAPREGYPGFVKQIACKAKAGKFMVTIPSVKVWTVVVFRISSK